jgi:predicted ATPase
MIHLKTISLPAASAAAASGFPWSVPSIRSLAGAGLELSSDIVFFVGENGSGKSTLLEAIACAAQSITVGSEHIERDATLDAVRTFGRQLKLSWTRRTRRGFFMRSEDFFGYAKHMQALRAEAEAELQAIQRDASRSRLARDLASMPHARTVHEIKRRYGDGLDSVSHGESFFTLFKSRFVPDGLYLLDEPEAPLSPKRQLGLISLLKTMVQEHNAQFIIATHSPILMAFPGATIYSFDEGELRQVAYEEVEHVTIMRDFLRHPHSFLQHL